MDNKKTGNNAEISPVKLGLDTEFQFECHKGVSCFTKCCRGIDIMLTPYDIMLLKNHMGISSEEFLSVYTEPQLLEKTDLPVVTLRLLDDDQKSCPFVKDDGCLVYEARPTTCRYYPLGVGSLSHREGTDEDDFFFFINEPHCKGFEEEKKWTVKSWREDQGVDIHDDVNAGWTDLMVLKRSFPPNIQMSEKAKQMFFMVCYNIDAFKSFVFESKFLEMYKLEVELVEQMKDDEVALMEFGFSWLRDLFFNTEEKSFKVDGKIAGERKK